MTAWGKASVILLVVLLAAACGDSRPTRADVRDKRVNDPVRRDSVSARVGPIRLLGMQIQKPEGVHAEGSNSALFLTITTDGAADRLVAVSSVDARSVVVRDGDQDPAPRIDVTIPAKGAVSMQQPTGLHLELVDLTREVGTRTFVPVTFRFEEAGSVEVKVLVSGVARQVVPPLPSPSG